MWTDRRTQVMAAHRRVACERWVEVTYEETQMEG